jgi:hypothetical protein
MTGRRAGRNMNIFLDDGGAISDNSRRRCYTTEA